MVREWVALALAALGVGAFAFVLVALGMEGEWGRIVLVGVGLTLCLAARTIGRYDPEEAAARRELRNRARSG